MRTLCLGRLKSKACQFPKELPPPPVPVLVPVRAPGPVPVPVHEGRHFFASWMCSLDFRERGLNEAEKGGARSGLGGCRFTGCLATFSASDSQDNGGGPIRNGRHGGGLT